MDDDYRIEKRDLQPVPGGGGRVVVAQQNKSPDRA